MLEAVDAGGTLLLGVCIGAEVLASAGLLDGRVATSHSARLDGHEPRFPEVDWQRGIHCVDDGDVITTGGLLSSIDGPLRVVERLAGPTRPPRRRGPSAGRYYSPGASASMPESSVGGRDVIVPLNAAYRRASVGVLLTDGVGELELASVFDTHGQSSAARTVAIAVSTYPVRSRHGLTFVPRAELHTAADGLDRLLVPGADAARNPDPDLAAHARSEHGLSPEYTTSRGSRSTRRCVTSPGPSTPRPPAGRPRCWSIPPATWTCPGRRGRGG